MPSISLEYQVNEERFAVYVSRDLNVHTGTRWALFAATYANRAEAEEAAVRAFHQGWRHAEVRTTRLFSLLGNATCSS